MTAEQIYKKHKLDPLLIFDAPYEVGRKVLLAAIQEALDSKEKELQELREALENLVELKRWKDENGKDHYYNANVDAVWVKAFNIVDTKNFTNEILKCAEEQKSLYAKGNWNAQHVIEEFIDKINSIPVPDVEGYLEGKVYDCWHDYGDPIWVVSKEDALAALQSLAADSYAEKMDAVMKATIYLQAEFNAKLADKDEEIGKLREECEVEKSEMKINLDYLRSEVERLKQEPYWETEPPKK